MPSPPGWRRPGRSACGQRRPCCRSSASTADPAALAAAVGVQHLVVGTIQPTGQAFRVTVQLVQSDGVAIWGHTYDEHPAALLFDLQDRVAEQVVAALSIELAGPDLARLHVRYTSNPAAYDHYLRGRSLLVNYTEANMRSAIQHFEQALILDPNYALARAGIATACAWFSVRYAHLAEEIIWAKRADDEAKQALAQDASLAEAHLAIASAAGTAYGGWDWKILLERTAVALAIDPSLEFAHLARMRAFYHLGLFDAAAAAGRAAVKLNPGHSVEFDRLDIALMLFRGEFSAAVERAEPLSKRTDAPAVPQYLGLARYYTGDVDGARAMLGSIMRADRPDIRAQASLASIEAASGKREEAQAALRKSAASPTSITTSPTASARRIPSWDSRKRASGGWSGRQTRAFPATRGSNAIPCSTRSGRIRASHSCSRVCSRRTARWNAFSDNAAAVQGVRRRIVSMARSMASKVSRSISAITLLRSAGSSRSVTREYSPLRASQVSATS